MKRNMLRIAADSATSDSQVSSPTPLPKTVCIVGLGYIGLPTACVLAGAGYEVLGVDVRRDVVDKINAGILHIEEPGLEEVLKRVVGSGALRAATAPQAADAFIICVPTPHHADHSPDMTFVESAARSLRPHVRANNLVILESTSPPRSTETIVVPHAIPSELVVGRDVFVAHCPERVLPGRILHEVVHNDRIVGGMTPECTLRTTAFYESFVRGQVIGTTSCTAELTKLVENSYRDVNIAFANELSLLCDHMGIDVWEVIELANRHPRVKILNPGPGVGGHCISVDPWFLVHAAPAITRLIRTAREVNDAKPQFVVQKVLEVARHFEQPVIGCLGLTYKADVDDIRESPSIEIVRSLRAAGQGTILACDPHVSRSSFHEFPLHSLDEVLARCHVLVLLTDHSEFRNLAPALRQGKFIIDSRGTWREKNAGTVTSGTVISSTGASSTGASSPTTGPETGSVAETSRVAQRAA